MTVAVVSYLSFLVLCAFCRGGEAMSGTARILHRLRQGPATAAELYALHCIVHSRISELRKQGHRIVCSRAPGMSGPAAYSYQIEGGPLREREGEARTGLTAQAAASRSLSDPLVDGSLTERDLGAANLLRNSEASMGQPREGGNHRSSLSVSDSLTRSEPEPQPRDVGAAALSVPRPSGSEQLRLIEARRATWRRSANRRYYEYRAFCRLYDIRPANHRWTSHCAELRHRPEWQQLRAFARQEAFRYWLDNFSRDEILDIGSGLTMIDVGTAA